MDSVFNDHVFPKYKDQQVMKPQMHGFNDPTLRNFMLLKPLPKSMTTASVSAIRRTNQAD